MNERWLAIFSAIVGVFLVIVGSVAAWGIVAAGSVTLDPLSPFGTKEHVEWAKSATRIFWLITVEGLGLGAVAFVSAVGLLRHRRWALPTLVTGSVVLALLSVAIIIVAPDSWDIQIFFLALSGLLWWQLWHQRRSNAPAL